MKTVNLGGTGFHVPALAVGCMRINKLEKAEADRFVKTALDLGAVFFDHADVYGDGECEEIFSDAIGMTPSVREKIFLQSKCGIKKGKEKTYDFSKDHILYSVDGSLKRLKTEYLDVLLLHRPDALVEPEEVAEAFGILQKSGKVRFFGVSNQNPMQIELLKRYVKQPIVTNQLQLSIMNCSMISQSIYNNLEDDHAVQRDGSVLDYCRLNDITIQPWSPFQYGLFKGVYIDNPDFPEINAKLNEMAKKYSVSNTTIAIAWLLRHPAKMQPVSGTTNIQRLRDCVKAADITLSRDDWYSIYQAAGNKIP